MSAFGIFLQLINGKGHPNFFWKVTRYIGNDKVKDLKSFPIYSQALIMWVNLPMKQKKQAYIELWFEYGEDDPQYVGDNIKTLTTAIDDKIITL